jgi:glycosyltransferase involved in cell wall biosynthesis
MDRRLILFPAAPDHPVKRFGLAQEAVAGLDGRFAAEMVGCGGVPYNLMPTYMNACDVLLLTSLHEGSPNAVKEALACNLPVVSVDVGDVRERVDSVEGSVVCEDDRPDTIATALAEVLSRSGRVDSRSAVSHLDERVLTRRVISVYRQAIHA